MAIKFLNTVAVDNSVLFVDTVNNRVGIGTDSPERLLSLYSDNAETTPRLLIEQDGTGDAVMAFSLTGGQGWSMGIDNSGGDSFMIHNSAGGVDSSSQFTIKTSGNVGIGTTNPTNALHVNSGATNEVAKFVSTDGAAYLSIMDSTTANSLQGVGSVGDSLTFYSNNAERMRITSSGNVGIGMTSPADKLHVSGRVLANAFRTDVNTGDYSVISRDSAGNSPLYVQSANNGANQPIAKFFYGNAAPNQGSIVLNVAKDETYFSNTNVGIGTTAPGAKLEVAEGYILASGSGTSHGFQLSRDSSDTYQIRHLDGGLTIYNSTDSRKEMTFKGDGNVGIGTTSPSQKLQVSGSGTQRIYVTETSGGTNTALKSTSSAGYVGTDSTDPFYIQTDSTTRITIDTLGKVGVGTTAPDTKLSVVGATSTNDLIGGSINLATTSGWVIPSGIMSTRAGYYGGDFTLNGSYTENGIEWGLGPFNDRQLLWTTIGSTDSNSDGGWNKTLTNLDIDSPYLSVVYFKRVSSSASGTFYHGTGNNILNLDGTSNVNPYFTVRALSLFDQGVWYASVGVIQSNSDSNTTTYQDISGLYRLDTGVKVANANAYKFASTGATLSRGHRAYLYYSTDTSVVGHFANPGFYKIDGDQPKLHDIVGGDSDDVFWSANGNSIYNDNSGNVGIGTSSPGAKLDIIGPSLASQFKLSNTTADTTTKYGALVGRHYTNSEAPVTGMLITSNSSATGGTVSIGGGINAANAVNNIILYTAANNTTLAGTERMRVASNGNVGIGVTSPTEKLDVDGIIQSNASGFQIDTGGFGDVRLRAYYGALNTSATLYVGGVNGYSYKGVYALSFNVNSDYRLKTNVVDLEEAIERVKQINVHRFNWNDRLDEEKVDGFLAHELAEVIPEAVTGEKDAVREDGTLDYQGVDQSKVVPLLTAALQEAISKIEQLETRIQTLENN